MKKKNCWEMKKCGREPGGKNVRERGICPVTTHQELDGIHGGKNAGRACWVVAGTLCDGSVQGAYEDKLLKCWQCDFQKSVKREEQITPDGFCTTRLAMEGVLRRSLEKGGQAASTDAGIRVKYSKPHPPRDCRNLIQPIVEQMLGSKSTIILEKLNEMNAKYDDDCWNHMNELDKAARMYYGNVIAEKLITEIALIVRKTGD